MFCWNFEKNSILIETRGISFDEIIEAINQGLVLSDTKHPNSEKFPNQRLMIIAINNYTFMVPYVIDGNDIFLKTIIPSRKAYKKYGGPQNG
jgi:uncharacterized DUF497 family protein